jgi:hypothetical protein
MDAVVEKCLLEGCGRPVVRSALGRPQRFCSDAHRKAHSRLNGHENPSDRQSYPGGENTDLAPSQALDIVEAVCPFNQEQQSSRRQLYFEEWPQRQKKTDRCIAYVLTDGKLINTGYGRASRPLGYVMEIWPGRWVARVGNIVGLPSSLTAAKQAAISLYRSRKSGEPKDWIAALNQIAANEVDRAAIERQRRQWPLNLMGMNNRQNPRWKADPKSLDREAIRTVLETERVLIDRPKPESLKGDDIEMDADGYPILLACLDRRPKETA